MSGDALECGHRASGMLPRSRKAKVVVESKAAVEAKADEPMAVEAKASWASKPVRIDPSGQVTRGHHRVRAAREAGVKEISVEVKVAPSYPKLAALWRGGDAMDREYVAWRQVCKQLGRLGVDVNEAANLVFALKLWAHEHSDLMDTYPEDKGDLLDEVRMKYDPVVIEDGEP